MGLGNLTRLLNQLRKPITFDADGITSEARDRIRASLVHAAETAHDGARRDAENLRGDWIRAGFGAYLDPVQRVILHQPCEGHACHHPGRAAHCRCGNPWVCALAGPLNGGTAVWS